MEDIKGYKWFYIPIDIKVREIYGKLLLGLFAAEAGYEVVIGDREYLSAILKSLPPGVYLGRTVAPGRVKEFGYIKSLGHRIVATDEEGIIYQKDVYCKHRLGQNALDLVDKFFLWGDVQFQDVSEYLCCDDRLTITGNPRIDVLRPEYRDFFKKEVQRIREKYGPYFLVNTNFATYNNYYGENVLYKSRIKQKKIETDSEHDFYRRKVALQKHLYNRFVEAVHLLADAFPTHRVIIRPHPSEKHEVWDGISAEHPKVHVIHEGSAIPWIMGADALIHNGCTTGLESYLLGVPGIALRAEMDENEFGYYLPNMVSYSAFNDDELLKLSGLAAVGVLDPKGTEINIQDVLKLYLSDDPINLSGQRIVAVLNQLEVAKYPTASIYRKTKAALIGMSYQVRQRIKRLVNPNLPRIDYKEQVFDGLSLSEMQEMVARFKGQNSSFGDFKVEKLCTNCFCIHSID